MIKDPEIYLDSKITSESYSKNTIDNMGLLLNVDEFNIHNGNNNKTNININNHLDFSKVIIPNENISSGTEDTNSVTNHFTMKFHRYGSGFGSNPGASILGPASSLGIESGTLAIFFVKSGTYIDDNIIPIVTTGYSGTTQYGANITTNNNRITGVQHHTTQNSGWGTLSFSVGNIPHNTSGNLYMIFYAATDFREDLAIDETIHQYNDNTQIGEPLYALSDTDNTSWNISNPNYNWTESGRHNHTINNTDYTVDGTQTDFEASILKLYLDPSADTSSIDTSEDDDNTINFTTISIHTNSNHNEGDLWMDI